MYNEQQDIQSAEEATPSPAPKKKHHLIRPTWLRVVLKTLMWLIIVMLLIPVLVYIPPVQSLLKDVACSIVKDSTGMDVKIDKLRIKFPVDVSLQGVSVVEASGDTMVTAKEAIADVRLMPLFHLDVAIKKLTLKDGYYRMVSPDSSMILKVRAGYLEADSKSSFNIAKSEILLNKVRLRDGDVDLFMDVWKQKPTPTDSSSTPFFIKANDIGINNIRFGMSMLPTIDTLNLLAENLQLRDGVIDLRKNKITIRQATVANGDVTYLTPTPEYIAAHPAPEATSSDSPPMVIVGDSLALRNFNALYAVKGASPLPGFDPSYIKVADVNVDLKNFYNAASTVKLPISSITATERSGLQIVSGSGLVGVDAIGLQLQDLKVTTTHSQLNATADIPFALMEMKPDAPLNLTANGSLGMQDVNAFMPAVKEYTSLLPTGLPLNFEADAKGTLADVDLSNLYLEMPTVMELYADGQIGNALDIDKLSADVNFEMELKNPKVAEKIAGMTIPLPTLSLTGNAQAHNKSYAADFDLVSSAGDVAGNGSVSLTAETYNADITIHGLDVAQFMPDMGVGKVSAHLLATGAGFNPEKPGAATEITADISQLEYQGYSYSPIKADATLKDGIFGLYLTSIDPKLDLVLEGKGTVEPDYYTFDVNALIHHIDLQALKFTPDVNSGNANIRLVGNASPGRWLYDVKMDVDNVDWTVGENYFSLPKALSADLKATEENVDLDIASNLTDLTFQSPMNLQKVVDGFSMATDTIMAQVEKRSISVDRLQEILPQFNLNLKASGKGLIDDFLATSGMQVDSVHAAISNDSLLRMNAGVLGFFNGTMRIDTLSATANQRGSMLDYIIHMGNQPGTLDEFADVLLRGYLGGNRASLSLTQKNIQGETGYRLGLTAALQDSTVTMHFTPLRATIAYMPWIFNADNYIDYSFNNTIDANILAFSRESSVLLKTHLNEAGDQELSLALTNIKVQDFISMSMFAPPIQATVNANAKVVYKNSRFIGNGDLGIKDFYYAKQRVGDFDMDFKAGYNTNGNVGASAHLLIDKRPVMTLRGYMLAVARDSLSPNAFEIELTRFPLYVANPFLGRDVAQLTGWLNGKMKMKGELSNPILNGNLACDSVYVRVPLMGSSLHFSENPITVDDNFLQFNKFSVYGANNNPLVLDGSVDARRIRNVLLDLSLNAQNFQLVGNDKRAKSDIYGKIFLNLAATAKGPLSHFDVNGQLTVLKNTDAFYALPSATAMQAETGVSAEGLVSFVNFADTLQVEKKDSIAPTMAMRINATLTLQPGMQVTVTNLTSNATDKVHLSPSGTLSYYQNYMGDMRLNGQLNLGEGSAAYTLPIPGMGQKKFEILNTSYVQWNGDIMNPTVNLHAIDHVKTNVTTNNNSRQVDFNVALNVTNTLSAPNIQFDLSTDNDLTIENELQSMTAVQRSDMAMRLLVTGQYSSGGTKTNNGDMAENMLYGFLESTLNNWAAKNIRGVDLSFGISQFDKTKNGQNTTAMTYSYQVSKSLFDNRFKIVVGGNYSTDANADENFSQNLINDISFEYMLKQTQNMSMYVRLFRHTGFESILEGEITQTGAGFVLNRRISNFKQLFRFRRPKRKPKQDAEADSVNVARSDSSAIVNSPDNSPASR